MLVELGTGLGGREQVEVGEEVELGRATRLSAGLALAQQIIDQHLRVDLLLDVEWRRSDHQIRPILLIFPAPDELRIEVAITALVGNADRAPFGISEDRLMLSTRDMEPPILSVGQRLDARRLLGGTGVTRRHRSTPLYTNGEWRMQNGEWRAERSTGTGTTQIALWCGRYG